MITKQIKEYSNRLRINIIKTDGFKAGDSVILLTEQEYQEIQDKINTLTDELNKTCNKLETMETQSDNFEDMMEKVTIPIQETHREQIKDKDNQIKQLTNELNTLKKVCSQFKDKINQLSVMDMVFRKKHHQIVNDFTDSLWIINKDDAIIDTADVPAITGDAQQEQD